MAIAFVKKDPTGTVTPVRANGVASLATTFDTNTTTGNLIVGVAHIFTSGGVAAPTWSDNKSNSWAIARDGYGSDKRVSIGYAAGATGGASHQVTVTPAATSDICLGAAEFSGVATTSPVDGTNGTIVDGGGTAISSGSVTPTGNAVYVAGCGYDGPATTLVLNWSGATELHNEPDSGWSTLGFAYIITSGAQNAGWTLGASKGWVAAIAAFSETQLAVTAIAAEASAEALAPDVRAITVGSIMSTITL